MPRRSTLTDLAGEDGVVARLRKAELVRWVLPLFQRRCAARRRRLAGQEEWRTRTSSLALEKSQSNTLHAAWEHVKQTVQAQRFSLSSIPILHTKNDPTQALGGEQGPLRPTLGCDVARLMSDTFMSVFSRATSRRIADPLVETSSLACVQGSVVRKTQTL